MCASSSSRRRTVATCTFCSAYSHTNNQVILVCTHIHACEPEPMVLAQGCCLRGSLNATGRRFLLFLLFLDVSQTLTKMLLSECDHSHSVLIPKSCGCRVMQMQDHTKNMQAEHTCVTNYSKAALPCSITCIAALLTIILWLLLRCKGTFTGCGIRTPAAC